MTDSKKNKDQKDTASSTKTEKDLKQSTAADASPKPEVEPTPRQKSIKQIRTSLTLLQNSVSDEDYHAAERSTRSVNFIRKHLTHKILSKVISEVAPSLMQQLESIAPKLGRTQAEEAEEKEETEEKERKENEAKEAAEREAALAAAAKELEAKNSVGAPLLARQASERRRGSASSSSTSDAMSDKPASALASVAGAPVSPIATSPETQIESSPKVKALKPDDYHPQVAAYLSLLVAHLALDRGLTAQAASQAETLFEQVWNLGTPTANDALLRQTASLLSLAKEREGGVAALADLRNRFITLLPSAVRFATYGLQAVIINTVLRSFLQEGMYAQADKFRLNIQFPDDTKVPSGLSARFYYYTARIQALQLQYASALDSVTFAIRKSPTDAGYGFQQSAAKLQIIIQLLLGEIPPRSLFNQPVMRTSLAPYFTLTKAVMEGSVHAFDDALARKELVDAFEHDSNLSLVQRLRQNVIYTALGKLTASYSRLPLSVVVERLQLSSVVEAELIVAKAIKDGSLEAQIDPNGEYLESKPSTNLYSSDLPRSQLAARIQYCLDVHAEATKALKFPSTDLDEEGLADPRKKKRNTMSAAAVKQEKRDESKKKDSDKK